MVVCHDCSWKGKYLVLALSFIKKMNIRKINCSVFRFWLQKNIEKCFPEYKQRSIWMCYFHLNQFLYLMCLYFILSPSPSQNPTYCDISHKWFERALIPMVAFPLILQFFPMCPRTLSLIVIYVQLLWRWPLGLWHVDVIDSDCEAVG